MSLYSCRRPEAPAGELAAVGTAGPRAEPGRAAAQGARRKGAAHQGGPGGKHPIRGAAAALHPDEEPAGRSNGGMFQEQAEAAGGDQLVAAQGDRTAGKGGPAPERVGQRCRAAEGGKF